MLKGIDPIINAELIYALMLMGHGDEFLICDVNHPAQTIAKQTTHGKLVDVTGCGIAQALRAILTLFPLDTFVEAPVKRMDVVGNPDGEVPIFKSVQDVVDAARGSQVEIESLERFAFYEAAKKAFVVIRTTDPGPYGCFIVKKGVM